MNIDNISNFYNKLYIFFIILIMIILTILYFIIIEKIEYINRGYYNYNYKEYDNFLSKNECKDINLKIRKSNLIKKNPLNEYFKKTKGFMIQFKKENDIKTFKSNNIEFLYDIYLKIIKPYSNYFVLNILAIDPLHIKSKFKNKNSVDFHYDCTISEDDERTKSHFFDIDIVPECVNVIYTELPDEFEDGRLILYKYSKLLNIGKLKPSIGKMIEFNGRLCHGVENIIKKNNNDTKKRISIVLEQYSL